MATCPYCPRPTAGDICPAHGYVGPGEKKQPSPFFHGFITDFYGTAAQVPQGWAICDGTNGTPDMRGKVSIGAGGVYSVGGEAGTNSAHTHSVSIGSTDSGTAAISTSTDWTFHDIDDAGIEVVVGVSDSGHSHSVATVTTTGGTTMQASLALYKIMYL
jgi:hypothetical protein